jgi:hypothetical protein
VGVGPVSGQDALVVGRGFSAVTLRVAVLLVGIAIVFVPLQAGITVGTFVLLLPAVVASAYAPASPAPAAVIVIAAVLVAAAGGDALRGEVLALIPLTHLFHVLCGIAGAVPATGRIHPRALWRPALRFLGIQAVMAVLVALAAFLPVGPTAPLVEALALVGLAGVALVVVRLQRVR